MDHISTESLFITLGLLIVLSGLFSSSETALMSLNRYRLKHLAKEGNKGAQIAFELLQKPDRLIGIILLGNNFANILASSITTVIALRLMGETGIAIAAGLLTLVILIFAEVAPKTLAANHPEKIAFPAARIYYYLIKFFYPLVFLVNTLSNSLLWLIGHGGSNLNQTRMTASELRTLIDEPLSQLSSKDQKMLSNILDLEKIKVDDIMVPRNDISGIDLDDSWASITTVIRRSPHTRIPIYKGSIDNVVGILHLRKIINFGKTKQIDKDTLLKTMSEPYFIPEETTLTRQLINFQKHKRRIGLIVDEYGDILGLITLEDILEEIVGDFLKSTAYLSNYIQESENGTFIVSGHAPRKEIEKLLKTSFEKSDAKTLNGIILEQLQSIPKKGMSLLINHHPIEITRIEKNTIRSVIISPSIKQQKESDEQTKN